MQPTSRPARLGHYQLTEWLGQSGMANLFRARLSGPLGFEKTVLVKAMLPALVDDQELVARFTATAQTTARLSHPGIMQVHDYQVDGATPFIVSEHADGLNLAQLMAAVAASGRRVPVAVAVVIATEICQALALGHGWRDGEGVPRQIIHTDLSPEGVMVCRDGSIKLLDFGLARVVEQLDFEVLVKSKGNFAYMAPEQVNRLPFDCRVDVFSAGVVLHELLTGRRLFGAPSDLETLRRIDAAEVAPPSLYNGDVSPLLDNVVLKALARDPEERFADGAQMAAALEQFRFEGGGRRRVADFLGSLFPERGHTHCEVCHKELVMVLLCVQCTGEVPAQKPPPVEEPTTVRVEPSPVLIDLSREKSVEPPATPPPPPKPRPRSVTMVVTPPPSPAPKRGASSSLWVWRALLGVGIGAIVGTLALDIVARRPVRVAAPAPVSTPAPVREPAPAPVVAPVAVPPVAPVAAPAELPSPPSAPKPEAAARPKHSPRTVQRALPRLPPPPVAPPEKSVSVERTSPPLERTAPPAAELRIDGATHPPSGSGDPRLLDPWHR
jgi:serine/threonine-protein kinase